MTISLLIKLVYKGLIYINNNININININRLIYTIKAKGVMDVARCFHPGIHVRCQQLQPLVNISLSCFIS